eukprot:2448310-Prymnesium_polylepis.1
MLAAVSQPLSLSAWPAEAGRARERTRRTTWRRFADATFLMVRDKVNRPPSSTGDGFNCVSPFH